MDLGGGLIIAKGHEWIVPNNGPKACRRGTREGVRFGLDYCTIWADENDPIQVNRFTLRLITPQETKLDTLPGRNRLKTNQYD